MKKLELNCADHCMFATHPGPHQYALVDVPIADALHADPDDARVRNLFVVEGLLWRAAG